jgi:ABC-type uncharacterized transport system permease subunit
VLISLITSFIYLSSATLQGLSLAGKPACQRFVPLYLNGIALSLHAYLLYQGIDTQNGQNLSIFNMLSLWAWLLVIFTTTLSLLKPLETLTIFVSPLAAACILSATLWPGQEAFPMRLYPHTLVHILISILAFGLLGLAALQASALAIQQHILRKKLVKKLTPLFPPLQTMQRLLLWILSGGFVLLTASLLSGCFFMSPFSSHSPRKLALSAISWLLFAFILYRQYHHNGSTASVARWSLVGIAVLSLAYFGSKFLI